MRFIFISAFQYEQTRQAVFEAENSIETLVDLLQIFRDNCQIFTSCCMLLGIMGFDENRREVSEMLDVDCEISITTEFSNQYDILFCFGTVHDAALN